MQSDKTILLEVNNPYYELCRNYLIRFAELLKSPEHIHTYKITNLSLWNASAIGLTPETVITWLETYSRYPIRDNVTKDIRAIMNLYGRLKLKKYQDDLVLESEEPLIIQALLQEKNLRPFILGQLSETALIIDPSYRGHIKQLLVKLQYPAEDLAGYKEGEYFPIELRAISSHDNHPFTLRKYQQEATDAFYHEGKVTGGSGTIVLPCGAGKTIIGIGIMDKIKTNTLIICTSIVAVHQWKTELEDKTTINPADIGEFHGEKKEIKPITITTYQILTYSPPNSNNYPHFQVFSERNWGLIIYDEVHLLPAPVFRITAELQATRRLGLTATLIREDKREPDIFSLIGPKKYDLPWKDLEEQGWIAPAICFEIRVSLPKEIKFEYYAAEPAGKYRIAAENPEKRALLADIVSFHQRKGHRILIIGSYIRQLKAVAEQLNAVFIHGKTKTATRLLVFEKFKTGALTTLVISKVGNFAVDLPDANVLIQISGTFGSRQEEAQRLGRILRPRNNKIAYFYTLVTKETHDQKFAANRQLFLTEQGYRYYILESFQEILKTLSKLPQKNLHQLVI